MTALGNFLLGSYLTGMIFCFFFAERLYDGHTSDIDIPPCRFFTGIFWPIVASVFLIIRFSKAFCTFWSGK